MSAALRKGWCPGALRPMAARDGLLVRLRITGGILSSAKARAIADLATAHGNGLFDLSARANLQMRGVRDEALPALWDGLRALDLLDTNLDAETVRNVIASPLAGLHDGLDIRPIVAALEARLVEDDTLHALPTKFGFLVDDGSVPSLASVAADVRFDWDAGAEAFRIGLGGTAADATRLGCCGSDDLVEVATRMAHGAVTLFARHPEARRMRALIASLGEGEIKRSLGVIASEAKQPRGRAFLWHSHIVERHGILPCAKRGGGGPCEAWWRGLPLVRPSAGFRCDVEFEIEAPAAPSTTCGGPPPPLRYAPQGRMPTPEMRERHSRAYAPGLLRLRLAMTAADVAGFNMFDGVPCIGLAAPFGALDATMLRGAADLAETHGADELRLTPWRTILVLRATSGAAPQGFITAPLDPRLALDACIGRDGCERSTTATRDDATALADLGLPIHVSGCEKGCAKPSASAVTLVGRGGRYDLVRDGRASDPPIRRDLSVAAARAAILSLRVPT